MPSQVGSEEKSEPQRVEHAKFSGTFWILKNNWKKLVLGIFGIFLIFLAIFYRQLLFVYAILVYAGANGFGYFFWDSIITVPSTAVLDVTNADREIRVWLIPDAMLPEFDISGLAQTYRDQFNTDVIVADEFDYDDRKINCAYSHEVSNLNLAMDEHALETAKEDTLHLYKENAELRNLLDVIIEKRLHGVRVQLQDQPLENVLTDRDQREEIEEKTGEKIDSETVEALKSLKEVR
ncbi:hypothetical protein AKJ49_01330 [candidate division MSBL1 archaeon SCGC-AAA382A03]|uniref:Uncharacterized protein n=1 Tax=candidate division MSBL1 archaeon SCGC-AAA382A03 TaxID=1698278 RepID=A0A133VFI3_9EURY|nr:hypothetical protein AKJ49_01330 [candidate division MSBL1 archaeon SCGC-AAA382A03]